MSNYDFEKDAAVQNLFGQALDKGHIDKVVFFSNSPHYLMTESGMCTGAYEYQNNLKPEFYQIYSEYLMICVEGLVEKYDLLDKLRSRSARKVLRRILERIDRIQRRARHELPL